MKQLKQQKGFTLIELMIVIAIIGILAAFALPAYQNYTIRTKSTEVLNMLSAVKTDAYEYYVQAGEFPKAGGPDGADDLLKSWKAMVEKSKFVSNFVAVGTQSTLTATATLDSIDPKINTTELVMTFTTSGEGLEAKCTNNGINGGGTVAMLPVSCRTKSAGGPGI